MTTPPYSVITVSGADAFDFLQAQLAADLNQFVDETDLSHVHPNHRERDVSSDPLLSAWCNPKGRVICLFRVVRSGSRYSLTLPTELAEEALRRLTMFRFRAKVDFAVEAASAAELGTANSYEDWRLDQLRAGIPEILQAQSEEFTPHMLNLDLLGAVSVDKGCYPGQEIVARTHFRGKTKRRCLGFESSGPVSAGDKVSDGDRDIGEVLNAIGNNLLAIVPLDKADAGLTVNDAELRRVELPYL
jgi:folate-binding protein YgfZ